MTDRTCSIDGCERPYKSSGLCHMHYNRRARSGDAGPAGQLQASPGQLLRDFWRLANRITDDCIVWPHSPTSSGYGTIQVEGQRKLTHRLALAYFTGDDGSGMLAIHGPCHNRLCMNARGGHLRWGTQVENMADRHRDGTANRRAA